jgi:hypothetical protein
MVEDIKTVFLQNIIQDKAIQGEEVHIALLKKPHENHWINFFLSIQKKISKNSKFGYSAT